MSDTPNGGAKASVVEADLIICMRDIADDRFTDRVGTTRFLAVPPPVDNRPAPGPGEPPLPVLADMPSPKDEIDEKDWFDFLIDEASRGFSPPPDAPAGESPPVGGDVLMVIHGFNNDMGIITQRHRQLRKDLAARGYNGAVASFDWPSGSSALGYLSDRVNAAAVATRLVTDLVVPFAARVKLGRCAVNLHVLAHSTGAYLFQETVDMSDEHHGIADVNWTVSQLLLIGADIDQPAMEMGNGDGESMIAHATRITNYSNPYDEVLKLSNAKRWGLQPRIGRVGLPGDAPNNCVNVNCGNYYQEFRSSGDSVPLYGARSHSWQVGDPVWTDDLYQTILGNLDRNVLPTRQTGSDGALELCQP